MTFNTDDGFRPVPLSKDEMSDPYYSTNSVVYGDFDPTFVDACDVFTVCVCVCVCVCGFAAALGVSNVCLPLVLTLVSLQANLCLLTPNTCTSLLGMRNMTRLFNSCRTAALRQRRPAMRYGVLCCVVCWQRCCVLWWRWLWWRANGFVLSTYRPHFAIVVCADS